jgi:hypothetical protein
VAGGELSPGEAGALVGFGVGFLPGVLVAVSPVCRHDTNIRLPSAHGKTSRGLRLTKRNLATRRTLTPMAEEVVRLTLEGEPAEPGRIPAADVIRLLQGYERALGRAAEARVRRRARTGRRGGAVEAATRLIFQGIESGSLVAVLELPDVSSDAALDLDDARLGELAAEDVLALIEDPNRKDGDERVIDALATLGDDLALGTRYPALTIEWQRPGTAVPRRAVLTAEIRQRLNERRAVADLRRSREERVVGTLVEADFERHSARVVTSDGQRVAVTFTEEQADDIQAWLRQPGELEGRVEYEPRSGEMRSIELRSFMHVVHLELSMDEDFWRHHSVTELAQEQGVRVIDDLEDLVDHDATEEELAAFLDALGS